MGFPVLPSAVNFLLVKVGDGAQMRRCLLEHGILVRDCASFGLLAYIRVGVRRLGDCRRLTTAMREVLNNG